MSSPRRFHLSLQITSFVRFGGPFKRKNAHIETAVYRLTGDANGIPELQTVLPKTVLREGNADWLNLIVNFSSIADSANDQILLRFAERYQGNSTFIGLARISGAELVSRAPGPKAELQLPVIDGTGKVRGFVSVTWRLMWPRLGLQLEPSEFPSAQFAADERAPVGSYTSPGDPGLKIANPVA